MKTPGSSLRRLHATLRHLHPEQMRFQVQRRLTAPWRRPRRVAPAALAGEGRPQLRVPRCRLPFSGNVLEGEFRFWGTTARLDLGVPWLHPELGRPWSYPVQYCEYLCPLADRALEEPELAAAIEQFVEAWIDAHPPGVDVAWDPYPIALRIVSWLDTVATLAPVASKPWRQRVLESVYVQADWLSRNLERHLLGTHLLKNIKALLVASTCFDDVRADAWRRGAVLLLDRELDAQVDADGAHAEPSLMYHCVALEDVLDLFNFEGAVDAARARKLEDVAARMLRFAHAIQTPRGGFPLLGDAWDGGAPAPRQLFDYARRLDIREGPHESTPVAGGRHAENAGLASTPARGVQRGERLTFFARSGIAVWRDATTYVVADLGGMGTPHLSAHGHCDSLSFELWLAAEPWLVDSGTWTYQHSAQRLACRSTRAHNTVEVDGREQHEIWAAFRVGRRSVVRARRLSPTRMQATLVPWWDRGLRVQRQIDCARGRVEVADRVEGPGIHSVRSRFHVHPDCETRRDGTRVALRRSNAQVVLEFNAAASFEVLEAENSDSGFAERQGEVRPKAVIVVSHDGSLPFASTLTIQQS